jgi:hypothetical protein
MPPNSSYSVLLDVFTYLAFGVFYRLLLVLVCVCVQDTYVLHDNAFRLLLHLSEGNQYREEAQTYLSFACGLLTGALSNVGIKCQVTAEVTKMPACTFQVKVLL